MYDGTACGDRSSHSNGFLPDRRVDGRLRSGLRPIDRQSAVSENSRRNETKIDALRKFSFEKFQMDETVIVDCPLLVDRRKTTRYRSEHQSEDHLSDGHVIYLELIRPSISLSEHQGLFYHQFKLFFTLFTPKIRLTADKLTFHCPAEHLIDCDDAFCVHSNARCNGINDCRSKLDEESCATRTTIAGRAKRSKSTSLSIFLLFAVVFSFV